MLIFASVALLDPYKQLPAIEWQTRDRMYDLAGRFERVTGLHLQVRRQGGRRTCVEQNAIYAGGRDDAGNVVTYARGCMSWHVHGQAVDVDPVDSSGRYQATSAYRTAGDIWESIGGKWGGYFSGFADIGHFEWHPGLKIEQVCPDPNYCDVVEASVQTSAPLGLFMLSGVLVTGVVAAVGYGGWQLWKRWRQ